MKQFQDLISASGAPSSPNKLQALLEFLANASANNEDNAPVNNSDTVTGGGSDSAKDTLIGGGGNDDIFNDGLPDVSDFESGSQSAGSNSAATTASDNAKPQTLNDILNGIASGKSGVDYQTLMQNYPTPRGPAEPANNQDIYDYMMSSGGKGGASLGAGYGKALAYAHTQQLARQNAQNQALNGRDVDAFKSALGFTKDSGRIQSEAARTAQMQDYRANQIDMAQQRLDEAMRQHTSQEEISRLRTAIAQQVADQKKGGTGASTKPLSADLQKQLSTSLDQFIGVRDAKGNILDNDKDIDPTQKNKILSSAEMYLQQNPTIGVHGAIGQVINDRLGGIDKIQDSKWHLLAPNESRQFPNIDAISQQRGDLGDAAQKIANGSAPSANPSAPQKNGDATIAKPTTKADLDALPSGTRYINPVNNAVYIKP